MLIRHFARTMLKRVVTFETMLESHVLLTSAGTLEGICSRHMIARRRMPPNVSICVRAGSLKPRPVPDTERNKDTKTLNYTSTPLDANALLAQFLLSFKFYFLQQFLLSLCESVGPSGANESVVSPHYFSFVFYVLVNWKYITDTYKFPFHF